MDTHTLVPFPRGMRLILNSRTYQSSAMPNQFNRQDTRNFARYYPRSGGT